MCIRDSDWPDRDASRFVETPGLTWRVVLAGRGPAVLLLHGTGASAHSFRDLIPDLARDFTVVAPDLPGHGFTDVPPFYRLSLDGMARALDDLLGALDLAPALAVGHSAGAAVAVRMTLDRMIAPQRIVSLNGALLPFRGAPNFLFPAIAKALFLNPLTPRLVARRASERAVARLIADTGSRLEPEGIALYHRLMKTPAHIAGALGMMANWRLQGLGRDLPKLKTPITFVACARDWAIPPLSLIHIFRDNGPGVPPAEQQTLFSKFSRGWKEGSRRPTGSGLGLAISKQIMLQFGGELLMTASSPAGSSFAVRLPHAERARALQAAQTDAAPEAAAE